MLFQLEFNIKQAIGDSLVGLVSETTWLDMQNRESGNYANQRMLPLSALPSTYTGNK